MTVTISDVNDNTPTFGAIRYESTITELAAAASVVGAVAATDADRDSPNNVFDFAIVSGMSSFLIRNNLSSVRMNAAKIHSVSNMHA